MNLSRKRTRSQNKPIAVRPIGLGQPYIEHPRRVADRVSTPEAKAAALLHDVIEHTGITTDDLMTQGMPKDVIDCVVLLTRREDAPDDYYYRRIRSDDEALEVKLADLADNTDPNRLSRVAEPEQMQLRAKYRKAYASLGQGRQPPSGGSC